MKFTVPSKTLHNFASSVSKVINAKNALTILNNFLFAIEGNVLTITACDGENILCGRIPIMDVEGEGEFCIDARRIVELLRVMPEQELNFNIDDETLAIEMSHPNGSYKFMGLRGAEYPCLCSKLPVRLCSVVWSIPHLPPAQICCVRR